MSGSRSWSRIRIRMLLLALVSLHITSATGSSSSSHCRRRLFALPSPILWTTTATSATTTYGPSEEEEEETRKTLHSNRPSLDSLLQRLPRHETRDIQHQPQQQQPPPPIGFSSLLHSIRGGAGDSADDNQDDNDDNDDDERYSRQVFTLGARAHRLVRSSTVYLYGPPSSGLLYEMGKNLVLSGIRRLVLVVANDDNDDNDDDEENNNNDNHMNHKLDDLGAAYTRAAASEYQLNQATDDDGDKSLPDEVALLQYYLQRLNPSVRVEQETLEHVFSHDHDNNNTDDNKNDDNNMNPRVFWAVDPPSWSDCLDWNDRARTCHMAFGAVQTAGVYGQVFCDFGPQHVIHDADGEAALVTPLVRVVANQDNGTDNESNDDDNQQHHTRHITVTLETAEKHDVSKGDVVQFLGRHGNVLSLPGETVVEKVHTPFRVQVQLPCSSFDDDDDTTTTSAPHIFTKIQSEAVAFSRIKQEQTMEFVPLRQVMARILPQYSYACVASDNDKNDEPTPYLSSSCLEWMTPSDLEKSFDEARQQTLLACFAELDTFVQQRGHCPQCSNDYREFSQRVMAALQDARPQDDEGKNDDRLGELTQMFARSCAAKFVPLQGAMGAIAAQEVLKAVSGLYGPIRQFLLWDCDEVLSLTRPSKSKKKTKRKAKVNKATSKPSSETSSLEKTAPGLRHILGDKIVDRLQEQRIFVVGAGAIGCELLKNLAAMGAATCKKGKIVLTDMDTIEKSNLSRQLLFRDHDLGQFKSVAAERAALLFQPLCRIEAHSSKVGGNLADSPFNEIFWEKKVDTILNALDNVDARLYMDGQCVKYHKSLVDAGTMGPKGNVQVVVPQQSESYASSVDPPEESIPVCTLKNFPYAIAHTIQWARDLFDGLYVQRPRQVNDFVSSLLQNHSVSDLAHKILREAGEEAALNTAQEIAQDLSLLLTKATNVENIRSHSLQWAVSLAHKLYVESVDELLQQHPLDSKDEDGEDFWSGTRRPPTRLYYVSTASTDSAEQQSLNQNLIAFVRHGARLRTETFLSPSSGHVLFSDQEAVNALLLAQSKDQILASEEKNENNVAELTNHELVMKRLSAIPKIAPDSNCKDLSLADFEKDDELNGHIAFIAAASNLRAMSYGIPPVDDMETRRVAGRIIPAMISTTAFVSALSTLELIKLVQNLPLCQHRNGFINLALPFFAFTAPLPAETSLGLSGREYTLWDQMSIVESEKTAHKGGLKVKNLVKRIQKLASDNPDSVSVVSISLGPFLLYADFLHQGDKAFLQSTIWQAIEEALESEKDATGRKEDKEVIPYSLSDTNFELTVVVENTGTGEEVELPAIRLHRFKT